MRDNKLFNPKSAIKGDKTQKTSKDTDSWLDEDDDLDDDEDDYDYDEDDYDDDDFDDDFDDDDDFDK